MKRIYVLAFVAFSLLLLMSCSSSKNVAYIQNSDTVDFSRSEVLYDARIMPKDILMITVLKHLHHSTWWFLQLYVPAVAARA